MTKREHVGTLARMDAHRAATRNMLDVLVKAYARERECCDDDPTVAWANTCVVFSRAIAVDKDNPEAWRLVGMLVEAVARLDVAERARSTDS